MASALESGWQYLITHFTEFQLSTVGTFLLHESVFFLSGLPFIVFERAGFLNKYKIQRKNNTVEAQGKCVLHLLLYHFCVNLPVMLVSYPVFRYMGLRTTLPLPPWNVVLSQIIFYFIIEDFVFYWGHRVLHTKWLYKHVHSVHHEYATPFGLTSEYAHPAEILFLGFATVLGPALTGPHLFTLWLWMVLRVLETVEAHCGYHFPWSLSNFIPLYGGADFHDYHHRILYTKSGNYSSTFTYMDWLFGTDKGYRKLKSLEGMPNMPFLFAGEFIEELKKKQAMGTYKEMVIYVEACESGSIFEGMMAENLNIYVSTASNAKESSWGTYCPGMDPPPPPEYITCLGDLYSIAWMEDSETHNLELETIQKQYESVKNQDVQLQHIQCWVTCNGVRQQGNQGREAVPVPGLRPRECKRHG